MSYTYELTGTLNTGTTRSYSNDNWNNFTQAATSELGSVGYDSAPYYVTNILFDSSTLSTLRGKTLETITLEITPGTLERNLNLIACYKLNNSSTSWTRSDKDSSAASAADASILFKFNPNDYSKTSAFTVSAYTGSTPGTLTPKVPLYGLCIGPLSSNVNTRWKLTAVKLRVTTNETKYNYTLSYNANGGSGGPSNQTGSNIRTSPSYTFTLATSNLPTRTGYTFSGWSTTAGGSAISESTITITTTSQTLYAVWTKNSYTVKIQCLDPESSVSSTAAKFSVWYSDNSTVITNQTSLTVTKKYGDTVYIKDVTPYYSYYTISGVTNMTSDGNGQYHYTLNQNSANYTMTIKTARVQYTVSYNANGGTGAPSSQTKYGGVNLTLSSTRPTRNGYTFQKWNTKADGTGTNYDPSTTYTANAALTLYAVWIASSSTILLSQQSVEAGGSIYVYINKINSSATHTITYSIGSTSGTIATKTSSTEAQFTVPSSVVSQISGSSGQCTISCTTYINNTQSGVAQTAILTVTVPSSYQPSVSLTVTKRNTNSTVNSWGILLQGYSQVVLTATSTMASGATVSTYAFSGPGVSAPPSSSNSLTSNVITTSGKDGWSVTVTDSRGRTATATWKYDDFEVYAYSNPSITNATTLRTDVSGVASTGTFLKSKATLSISSANGHNSINVHKVEYKLTSDSNWTLGDDTITSNTWTSPYGGGAIDVSSAYNVRYTLSDALGNQAQVTANVPNVTGIGIRLLNDGLRLGGIPTRPGLQVDWDVDIVNRRTHATLSSPGWYRVLRHDRTSNYPGSEGSIIDIYITRIYNNNDNEVHKITLLCVYNAFRFVDERSISKTFGIDMLRVTYDSSKNIYVDIHYNLTAANAVSVYFEIHAGRELGTGKVDHATRWRAEDFRYINNTYVPDGETVATNRTLYQVTQGSVYYTACGKRWDFRKKDGVIYMDAPDDITSTSAGLNEIATLPEGWRPSILMRIAPGNNTTFMFVEIATSGLIRLYTPSAITSATNGSFSTSWITVPY